MAERRRSAHADVEQSDGGTLKARKPRDPLSSYIIIIDQCQEPGPAQPHTCVCVGGQSSSLWKTLNVRQQP